MSLPQARCPHCGELNPDDAFFCSNCGGQTRSLMTTDPDAPPATGTPDVRQPVQTGAQAGHVPPPPPLMPGETPSPAQPGSTGPPPYGAQPVQQGGDIAAPMYGYGMPPDGNTSGMGQGYPVPPEASGWTFAGCVPFGLFAFLNGSTLWGVLGIAGWFVGGILGIVYLIYIGVQGRDLAWRSRRFNSVQEYQETMRSWNTWGLVIGIGMFVFSALVMAMCFTIIYTVITEGL